MDELEQLASTAESTQVEAVEPSVSLRESIDASDADAVGLLATPEVEEEDIDLDGEKYRAPKKLAERLKELEQGSLRQDDYTRKTQTVAEERRAIEAERQQLVAQKQFQQQYIDAVADVKAIDKQLINYQKLDWNALTDADPVQAMKLDRQMRDLQMQRTQIISGIEQTSTQQQQAQQQAIARQRQDAVATLQREIKGFGTPEVAKELFETGTKYGIREDEWKNLDDPRLYKLINIARLYEKLVSKQTAEAKPKSAEVVPITRVTPGAGAARKSITDPNISMEDYIKLRAEAKRRK